MASIHSGYRKAINLPHLSGSALKVIAIISMVVDHCAYYLMEHDTLIYEGMRCFGRIAFPVFAFLVAEGFRYTRNRMRYFLQLLFFAVISEVPWYLLNGADGTHNVMFTLALGVVALAAFEKLKKDGTLCCCVILLIAFIATWSEVDYEWRGILVIVVFYLFGVSDKISFPFSKMMQLLCAFPLMTYYGAWGALLVCFILFLYNGVRGFINGSVAKYGFYVFYPLHLFIIFAITKKMV